MGHDHDHGAAALRAGSRHKRRLTVAFGLIAVFFVVEAVAGFVTNSLALLSDAGHMLTDVVGLGMALAAISLADATSRRHARTGERGQMTFGLYRLEILAAFVNSLLLLGVAAWVLVEAVGRIGDEPDVGTTGMLVVGTLGLVVNVVAMLLLRDGAAESVNVEGAYLEVLADTLGSVGVVVAAVTLEWFGWTWVDPVVGAAIGVWILPRTIRLGRQAVRILVEVAPPDIDPNDVADDLGRIDGVLDVHDLHVWTLTSDMESASAHLTIAETADASAVLASAQRVLRETYGVRHATLQVAPQDGPCCDELEW